jgi:hypothetical protein
MVIDGGNCTNVISTTCRKFGVGDHETSKALRASMGE